jgi:hypothetical protein
MRAFMSAGGQTREVEGVSGAFRASNLDAALRSTSSE